MEELFVGQIKISIRNLEEAIELSPGKIPKGLSGVYFLFNDIELIYIGETCNLSQRISGHSGAPLTFKGNKNGIGKIFNKIFIIETDDKMERRALEKIFINRFQPKYNCLQKNESAYKIRFEI